MTLPHILALPPERLVPQRPPILMVHGVSRVEGADVTSHFTVSPTDLFVENGALLEAGLIENMAQTAALRSGVMALLQAPHNGTEVRPPVGFIGAIKDFNLQRRPPVGATLSTTVRVLNDMGRFLVVQAEASDASGPCARCEMTIFISEG
jgi:predicted hotdog family 3-hydroxylacyl-ACP dehydratase